MPGLIENPKHAFQPAMNTLQGDIKVGDMDPLSPPGVSVKDHSLPPKMRKWHILPICGQFSAVTPRMSEPIMSPFLFYNRLGAVTPKNLWGIKIFTFLHIVA